MNDHLAIEQYIIMTPVDEITLIEDVDDLAEMAKTAWPEIEEK